MSHFSIFHSVFIESSPQSVYNALSQADHLINWWPLRCSGQAQVGNIYNFYFTPEYDWYGAVIQCEPNQSFHIKMTKSDPDWGPTSFGFDLEEKAGGVQLDFWHIGWPVCNHHFKRSSYCWAILLQGLKNYVEKGVIVPFEDRE